MIELNYGVLNFVVMVCNWVKTNYLANSPMVKKDEYGFIFENFSSLFPFQTNPLVSQCM
jgi:hypothetical protein